MENATNGVLETEINTWENFHELTKYFSEDLGFIFRGQADYEWELKSTLERFLDTLPKTLKNESVFKTHLKNFKESLRGRGVNHSQLNSNELWALGQHFGLYTPLLDWTYSFYIGLYFGFIDATEPQNGYRVVYALLKKSAQDKSIEFNNSNDEFKKFEIIESMSDENARIVNQAGLFTKIPFDFSLQKWVSKQFPNETNTVLFKIRIPNTERMRILKELDLMNINPKTMFPDIHGSSLNCNHKLTLFADKIIKKRSKKLST